LKNAYVHIQKRRGPQSRRPVSQASMVSPTLVDSIYSQILKTARVRV
jgi:hypothetical protein